MKQGFLLRLMICVLGIAYFQYRYLEKQNQVTKLRLEIPKISAAVKKFKEENSRLQFEIDQFENPAHLMEIARSAEFSHLKHPFLSDILTVKETEYLQPSVSFERDLASRNMPKKRQHLFLGAKPQ